MSLNIGPKLPAVEEQKRSGLEPPSNSPTSVGERFAAAVAELPESSRGPLMAYGDRELEFRVDDAIQDGNLEALKLLLDCGVKPTAMMLRFAIYKDKREAVELLLERGVDPNELWQHKHHLEKIIPYMELLISHGADVAQFTAQYGSKIDELLQDACADADVDRVKNLVICGADVNQVNHEGVPLVHVTWLSEHKLNGDEYSALLKAQAAIIRLLCEHGADPAQRICNRHPTDFRDKTVDDIMVCLLGQGMIKDYAPFGFAQRSANLAELVLRGLDSATQLKQGKGFHDSVRALIPLLTCKIPDVREKCADALAKAMSTYDWVVPEETQAKAHEALRKYLEELDGDPPLEVKRYAAKHNFPERLKEAEAKLLKEGLVPSSVSSQTFKITGNFSVREHALMLIEYAGIWAANPEIPRDHAVAILRFVQASRQALDLNDPVDRDIDNAIVTAIREMVSEAKAIQQALDRPQ